MGRVIPPAPLFRGQIWVVGGNLLLLKYIDPKGDFSPRSPYTSFCPPYLLMEILYVCDPLWEKVYTFCVIIHFTLCAILGILVDF